MTKSRLQNMVSGILAKGKDHIAKQAAVFLKLRPMQVAGKNVRLQIGCGAEY